VLRNFIAVVRATSRDKIPNFNRLSIPESVDRLIENRPYRSKLELVSRMVLTEAEYETIREKVRVAEDRDREPVKIA
jgi:hypothetical protein